MNIGGIIDLFLITSRSFIDKVEIVKKSDMFEIFIDGVFELR